MNKNDNAYLPFIYAMILASGIFLGYIISTNNSLKPSIGEDVDHTKMENILNYINNKYVDTVDTKDLETQAINEMLSTLDPHSFYIPPKDLGNINDDMRGDFEGVGVEFFIVSDTITIVNAIANGPSEQVGIMSGDKIIEVNDSLVAGNGIKNSGVVKLLKGPKGTKVDVKMLRNRELMDFTITRGKIPLYSVDISYMLDELTGIIKINRFSNTTYDEFYEGLIKLKRQGLKNLIIDLRGNGGGYLRTAVFIADELLKGKKLVVYTEGTHFNKQEYVANRPGEFEEGQLVVLIDENSASASEILSGALQDWDRAQIIGRRSFGKGLVQEQYDMADRSALRLTVARYYIPSGRSIQKPYTNEDEYHNEIYVRYVDGELYKLDSNQLKDTTVYYTKIKERKVYGGGGIIPDIFVPLDTSMTNSYINKLRSKIPEFVYSRYSSNSENFKQYNTYQNFYTNFNVSDNMISDFLEFSENKGWKKDLSKFDKNKTKIKFYIKSFFAKQLFQNEGYYRMMYTLDPVVKRSLEAIE